MSACSSLDCCLSQPSVLGNFLRSWHVCTTPSCFALLDSQTLGCRCSTVCPTCRRMGRIFIGERNAYQTHAIARKIVPYDKNIENDPFRFELSANRKMNARAVRGGLRCAYRKAFTSQIPGILSVKNASPPGENLSIRPTTDGARGATISCLFCVLTR